MKILLLLLPIYLLSNTYLVDCGRCHGMYGEKLVIQGEDEKPLIDHSDAEILSHMYEYQATTGIRMGQRIMHRIMKEKSEADMVRYIRDLRLVSDKYGDVK